MLRDSWASAGGTCQIGNIQVFPPQRAPWFLKLTSPKEMSRKHLPGDEQRNETRPSSPCARFHWLKLILMFLLGHMDVWGPQGLRLGTKHPAYTSGEIKGKLRGTRIWAQRLGAKRFLPTQCTGYSTFHKRFPFSALTKSVAKNICSTSLSRTAGDVVHSSCPCLPFHTCHRMFIWNLGHLLFLCLSRPSV